MKERSTRSFARARSVACTASSSLTRWMDGPRLANRSNLLPGDGACRIGASRTRTGRSRMEPILETIAETPRGKLSGRVEDGIYLNVWTPAPDSGLRPVLVWIHGGGFVIGSGSQSIYDGSRLARRGDVVVVTINYRLGPLGFLHLADLCPGLEGAAGNCGIRDQVLALEWVRDHVGAFGGDPGNVTIFGESAGGMSVGTLLGTPSARGLFQRAIAQSGACHNVHTRETATRVAEHFLEDLGVRPVDAARVLRELPPDKILDTQQQTFLKLG